MCNAHDSIQDNCDSEWWKIFTVAIADIPGAGRGETYTAPSSAMDLSAALQHPRRCCSHHPRSWFSFDSRVRWPVLQAKVFSFVIGLFSPQQRGRELQDPGTWFARFKLCRNEKNQISPHLFRGKGTLPFRTLYSVSSPHIPKRFFCSRIWDFSKHGKDWDLKD